jgi:hypothetical protein
MTHHKNIMRSRKPGRKFHITERLQLCMVLSIIPNLLRMQNFPNALVHACKAIVLDHVRNKTIVRIHFKYYTAWEIKHCR